MSDIPQVLTFTPLSTALQTVHQGKAKVVLEAVDDAIADVVAAVTRLAGPGKVVLTLTFVPKNGRVEVGAVVNQKKPEGGTVPALFYVDKAGRLVEDDPEQERLPFPETFRRSEA